MYIDFILKLQNDLIKDIYTNLNKDSRYDSKSVKYLKKTNNENERGSLIGAKSFISNNY